MESYLHLDPNLAVSTTIGEEAVEWHSVCQPPFALHGFYGEHGEHPFFRLPEALADGVSEGVSKLHRESAGGRVRFSTDSPILAVRAVFRAVSRSSHRSLLSEAGFDLYTDGEFGSRFLKEFRMPYDMTDRYEQSVKLNSERLRAYTVHFPIHAAVESLEIGIRPGSRLEQGASYRPLEPILFYGSSIVHGTAASRPGNVYPSMISRILNVDHKNLGFSGNAKGEPLLAQWMAERPMSAFVCDYDHNAPTSEHLAQTHYPLYEIIREKNPAVPYVMVTRPNHRTALSSSARETILRRRDVIMSSYLKARANGDRNVHFVDGMSFFPTPLANDGSVDGTHPNDLGFSYMANAIASVLRDAWEM